MSKLAEDAGEIARHTAEAADEIALEATASAREATAAAKELCQAAAVKIGDSLETSKDYVRRHPVPVVLGAIGFGVAIGYMLMMARRKPTFSERYADEPLLAVREAILGAIAPVTQRVHEGYDSARDGAEKTMGRLGKNLKFW